MILQLKLFGHMITVHSISLARQVLKCFFNDLLKYLMERVILLEGCKMIFSAEIFLEDTTLLMMCTVLIHKFFLRKVHGEIFWVPQCSSHRSSHDSVSIFSLPSIKDDHCYFKSGTGSHFLSSLRQDGYRFGLDSNADVEAVTEWCLHKPFGTTGSGLYVEVLLDRVNAEEAVNFIDWNHLVSDTFALRVGA